MNNSSKYERTTFPGVYKRTKPSGAVGFTARWRDHTGKQRSKDYPDFDEAWQSLVTLEKAGLTYADDKRKQNNTWAKENPNALGAYLMRVLDHRELRERSRHNYEITLRKHLAHREHYWKLPLGGFTPDDIRNLFTDMKADGVGPSARESIRQCLSFTFNTAVAEGVLNRSPMGQGKYSTVHRQTVDKELDMPTFDEALAIAAVIYPRFRVPVLVAAYAGLRIGEIGGLRVGDFDDGPQGAYLHVRRNVSRDPGGATVGPTKTKTSRRDVALPDRKSVV